MKRAPGPSANDRAAVEPAIPASWQHPDLGLARGSPGTYALRQALAANDSTLTAEFRAALSVPIAAADSELEDALAELLRDARSAWPSLAISDADFLVTVAEGVDESRADLESLARLHSADLLLATACAAAHADALAAFEHTYHHHVVAIVSRFQQSSSFRDEVQQLVRHRLLVSRPGHPAGIAKYAGTGQLLAFVRVVTVRVALDLLRKHKAAGEVPDDELEALPAEQDNPELRYLKALYRGEFKTAFETAVRRLPARAQTLLRYHLVDRLSIDKIALVYDVHRSTVARQIDRARQSLVADTRASLKARLQVDTSSFESIVRLIEGSVDLSVERILRVDHVEP